MQPLARVFVIMFPLLTCVSVLAQDFSEADLEGRYSFSAGLELDLPLLGSFVLDGAGGVTDGVRKFFRPFTQPPFSGATSGLSHQRHEIVEQTFTGSYSVGPDGNGTMTIIVTPRPEWTGRDEAGDPRPNGLQFDAAETIHFSAADGGRVLRFVLDMRASRLTRFELPRVVSDTWLRFPGEAERQDDSGSSCDSCELVALLAPLLPGGTLPSSHPCFVAEPGGGGAPPPVGRVRRVR